MPQLLFDIPALVPPLSLTGEPDLRSYDLILMHSSGGKDSQAAFEFLMRAAWAADVAHRVICVHADLGEMEWSGVPQLVQEHASHYKVPFRLVRRSDGVGLLELIEKRGKFPASNCRFCTSSMKRAPSRVLMTGLVRDARTTLRRKQIRVLNVMGMRAQESPARRRLAPYSHDGSETCPCVTCRYKVTAAADFRRNKQAVPSHLGLGGGASNSLRHVDLWLPVHHLSTDQVWTVIAEAGTRPHPAYSWGMPRLSCSFCVLASKSALILAAQLRPDLAATIARLESRIGHKFQSRLAMAEVIDLAACRPTRIELVEDWIG